MVPVYREIDNPPLRRFAVIHPHLQGYFMDCEEIFHEKNSNEQGYIRDVRNVN